MNTKIIEVWAVFLFGMFIIGDGVALMAMAVNPENTLMLVVLGAVTMFIGGYAVQLAFKVWQIIKRESGEAIPLAIVRGGRVK